jgi:hypothetical protein
VNLRISQHVSMADTEYGAVLLDERDGRYWQLTPSATVVVAELRRGGDVEAAVAELARAFAVSEETARTDTLVLVERLRNLGLVAP